MTTSEIKAGLQQLSTIDRSENFVSIGMTVLSFAEKIEGFHSALLICHDGVLSIMHFTSKEVIFDVLDDENEIEKYFIKKIGYFETENSELVSFKIFCKKIAENSNLKYGFLFPGGFYDSGTGKFFSETNEPEVSTCVGFCINVLTGWIYDIDKYFEFEDWDLLPISNPTFIKHFQDAQTLKPDLKEEDYQKHHRRISPNELTLSGYYDIEDMAIKKSKIESDLTLFIEIIQEL